MMAILAAASAGAASSPLRLTINGSQLVDPSTSSPLVLRGFNWQIGRTGGDPGALQKQLAPSSTMSRLVGVQWGNTHPLQHNPKKECLTHTPPHFFNEKCFNDLDPWIRSATDAGLWVVLAVRGEYVAGQLYDSDPGTVVFRNATLRAMLCAMWKHVAAHYASFDRIAAFEILSEPRDKSVSASAVRAVYEAGCAAVQTADPRTPCLVGGAPYYKLWTFGEETFLPNTSNVIYTFDYFSPDAFVFGRSGAALVGASAGLGYNASAPPIASYGARYPCSTLYDGWVAQACPSWNLSASDELMFDRGWHAHNLRVFANALKTRHNVPVFMNQFEVVRGVTAAAGRYAYIEDLLALTQQLDIGWAWWTWAGGNSDGWSHGSSEVVFHWPNGSYMVDTAVLAAMRPYW